MRRRELPQEKDSAPIGEGRHLSNLRYQLIAMEAISAVYTTIGIIVPASNEANSLYQDGYGSIVKDSRVLSLQPLEALYLMERQKVSIIEEQTKERLVFRELLQRLSEDDPDIWTRYIVYRDLRTRGFVVKGGKGPGLDFLVYERGSYGKKVPRYLIYTVWEGSKVPVEHLGKVLDEAMDTSKVLRLAVVDRRGEIVYYTLEEWNHR
jgi:tRNA-intron endonuclease